ncbi:sulfotransferase [Akkermansiaceae bacterium]|nr:sulfotransferase [Akkermansiaceae bacterium]MDA7875337.1 sulfotransferase [Akkermansiaceae bacterium]MDC0301379.1 sulfotransferase [Akkermansiaceae bacterium]
MQKHDLDFFLIGAQKCATSWMFYCLKDHPEICIPDKKIEIGYIGGEMFKEKGEDWFFDRFTHTGDEKVFGDVSVDYLYDLSSAETLRGYSSCPKFVLSLRDPLERMISSYYWLLRRGKLPRLPLDDGLKSLLNEAPGFPENIDSALEEVVRRSCYAEQIERYLHQYPPEDILVILYDEIKSDPLKSIQRVYRHIGVDDTFSPPSLSVQPKKNSYNRLLLAIESLANFKIIAKVVDLAHRGLCKISGQQKSPDLSSELRRELEIRLKPQIQAAREALKRLPAKNRPPDEILENLWRYRP